jgi:hypothetical protein
MIKRGLCMTGNGTFFSEIQIPIYSSSDSQTRVQYLEVDDRGNGEYAPSYGGQYSTAESLLSGGRIITSLSSKSDVCWLPPPESASHAAPVAKGRWVWNISCTAAWNAEATAISGLIYWVAFAMIFAMGHRVPLRECQGSGRYARACLFVRLWRFSAAVW